MVKFKIYDKNLQQFVSESNSDKLWKSRHDLGIWNNSVNDNKLREMYKIITRNDPRLEIHVKIDGRFKPVSKEVIDNIENKFKKKEPERKENRKKWKEYILKIRKNTQKRKIKDCRKKMKTYKFPYNKLDIKMCQKILKINTRKKK